MKKVIIIIILVVMVVLGIYYYLSKSFCLGVVVTATNRITGNSKVFSSSCAVPFWYKLKY
jgi:hypothetical protein